VFEFFKFTAPERLGFAKHREAAERKAAALAAAEVDAGETATSPRARGAPSKKTSKKTASPLLPPLRSKGKPERNAAPVRRAHPRWPKEPVLLRPALWGP
jgi:hypothetical protein